MQGDCQAVQDDDAAIIEWNAEGRQDVRNGTAHRDIHRGDVAVRTGRQMLDVGGDQLDMHLHGGDSSTILSKMSLRAIGVSEAIPR